MRQKKTRNTSQVFFLFSSPTFSLLSFVSLGFLASFFISVCFLYTFFSFSLCSFFSFLSLFSPYISLFSALPPFFLLLSSVLCASVFLLSSLSFSSFCPRCSGFSFAGMTRSDDLAIAFGVTAGAGMATLLGAMVVFVPQLYRLGTYVEGHCLHFSRNGIPLDISFILRERERET